MSMLPIEDPTGNGLGLDNVTGILGSGPDGAPSGGLMQMLGGMIENLLSGDLDALRAQSREFLGNISNGLRNVFGNVADGLGARPMFAALEDTQSPAARTQVQPRSG
jgi:hypothetical protein